MGDKEAIIPCSFDFDLKKKSLKKKTKYLPARTYSKKVVEDNQTIFFLDLKGQYLLLGLQRAHNTK